MMSSGGGGVSSESVGSVLATIANYIVEGLRILNLSDKRHWGPEEHEQVQSLERALDEAKKDFQELGQLVNGQRQYEHDRTYESIRDLTNVSSKFKSLSENLRDWSRSGGPINPVWIRETCSLQRHLHRAQSRAARRIFASLQPSSTARCLGAFLVHRKQKLWSSPQVGAYEGQNQHQYLEELVACKSIGGFERFGSQDIAFVCDFCDGFLIWEDLESVPTIRTAQDHEELAVLSPQTPVSPHSNNPLWQATGFARSSGQEKQVVFAPMAIANHIAPEPGGWQAGILCPSCEEEGNQPQDEDDEEDAYKPDCECRTVEDFREHLEWQHTTRGTAGTGLVNQIPIPKSAKSCLVM